MKRGKANRFRTRRWRRSQRAHFRQRSFRAEQLRNSAGLESRSVARNASAQVAGCFRGAHTDNILRRSDNDRPPACPMGVLRCEPGLEILRFATLAAGGRSATSARPEDSLHPPRSPHERPFSARPIQPHNPPNGRNLSLGFDREQKAQAAEEPAGTVGRCMGAMAVVPGSVNCRRSASPTCRRSNDRSDSRRRTHGPYCYPRNGQAGPPRRPLRGEGRSIGYAKQCTRPKETTREEMVCILSWPPARVKLSVPCAARLTSGHQFVAELAKSFETPPYPPKVSATSATSSGRYAVLPVQ